MKSSKTNAFTLIELLVVISIIAILASIAVPVFGKAQESATRTKALSNGKQIGLACRLFSQDYNGLFPQYTDPVKKTGEPTDSNVLFATLIPDYCADETIFTIPKSAYSKRGADGNITGAKALETGENAWAYMLDLSDTSNSRWPLIVTAPSDDRENYSTDESEKGGLWRGEYAVAVRCDMSATIEKCVKESKTSKKSHIKRDDDPSKSALTKEVGGETPWLTKDSKLLIPN